jgi:menaquinone-dependent protoporphyrinogen IX oxidase
MKALVVFGTRYGATARTSEEIAKILTEQGLDIKVADAKEEKIRDITSLRPHNRRQRLADG